MLCRPAARLLGVGPGETGTGITVLRDESTTPHPTALWRSHVAAVCALCDSSVMMRRSRPRRCRSVASRVNEWGRA